MNRVKQQRFILILLAKGLTAFPTRWMIWAYRFLSVSTYNGNKRNVPFILMLYATNKNDMRFILIPKNRIKSAESAR